jgi:hypothetical protein
VIHAEVTAEGVVISNSLPSDGAAYIDGDWIPSTSAVIPALVALEGALSWCDGPSVPIGANADVAAASALLAVAREAVAAVGDRSPASVEVTGSGLTARHVRALLGRAAIDPRSVREEERPRTVVDTTGDPEVIAAATRRLADLGTLVLAGEALGRTIALNFYPDVHVRGLRLVGVPPPLHAPFTSTDSADVLDQCRESLVQTSLGVPFPRGAAWYRLSG